MPTPRPSGQSSVLPCVAWLGFATRQEGPLCGLLRSARSGWSLRFGDGAVMVAARRDLWHGPPSRVSRPGAACGRWDPSGGPQCRQSPCSAKKRRSTVPTVALGATVGTDGPTQRDRSPLPWLNRGRRIRRRTQRPSLSGTSRSIAPHGPQRVAPRGHLLQALRNKLVRCGKSRGVERCGKRRAVECVRYGPRRRAQAIH